MTISKDACQRCFQQRQGLVPLSDLVRELHDLGVHTLICRSCMKELQAAANFLNFQGCEIRATEALASLSSSTTGETSEKSKKDPGKDFAVESREGAEGVKLPKT